MCSTASSPCRSPFFSVLALSFTHYRIQRYYKAADQPQTGTGETQIMFLKLRLDSQFSLLLPEPVKGQILMNRSFNVNKPFLIWILVRPFSTPFTVLKAGCKNKYIIQKICGISATALTSTMARSDIHLKLHIHIHYPADAKWHSGCSGVKYMATAQNKLIETDFLIKLTMIMCLARVTYDALVTRQ